jgi:hypothetical protein
MFNDGETVETFTLRLSTILSDLEMLGDPENEPKAMMNFVRVLPRKYRQMASSIESPLDIKTMSIEELSERLHVLEENESVDGEDDFGKLLLTEECRARFRRGAHGGRGTRSGGDHHQDKNRGKDRDDKRSVGDGANASDGSKKDDTSRYCGKKGHWARECRKKKRAEVHVAKVDDHADPFMLFAEGVLDDAPPIPVAVPSPR